MSEDQLNNVRHTLAHLLAAAVVELYPDAKRTIGPAIDNGFYFDFDFPTEKPSEDDLAKIEQKMRDVLPSWTRMERHELSPDDAKKEYPGNEFKHELIDEFGKDGKKLTFYKSGEYWDLCRGGHVENPAKDIDFDSFKLDRVAGAYWRGDEKNKMLTRIYGLAYSSKKELDEFLAQREEAAKRDHRKIGHELDLFLTSDLVGPGLPLWTPRGTIMRHCLDTYVWELRERYGYSRVAIPHITKKDLYERSGHWAKFSDELFRIKTREGKEYALKPMNCPHHIQIFDRRPHSYREMPQRYAETTIVYRDEQSGELGGLTRVLSITQDDSHVFCRTNQVKDEFFKIWDMVDTFYKTFGFSLRVRLSFRDSAAAEKYLGTPEIWDKAERELREIAQERGADYFEGPGEAAMYGPKLDFMATDSMGRQHQVATIQLDMNQPDRFDLTCINEKGEKERIVMIHCAIMGSIERFAAVLIEHFGGIFPLWLSPIQTVILPISEKHAVYAEKVWNELKSAGVRSELDASNESLGKRIRAAKQMKVPYVLVVGDEEIKNETATLEGRSPARPDDSGRSGGEKIGALSIREIISRLNTEIEGRV